MTIGAIEGLVDTRWIVLHWYDWIVLGVAGGLAGLVALAYVFHWIAGEGDCDGD